MTRKDFVELAKKGWEKYDYLGDGRYFNRASFGRPNKHTTCCCALGAAVTARGGAIVDLFNIIDTAYEDDIDFDYTTIIRISDDAGSKEAAIKALEAWAA
jgi:hypothetical protein